MDVDMDVEMIDIDLRIFDRISVDKLLDSKASDGVCDLDNAVHPLVAQQKWSADIEWPAILPGLQLFSHLLETQRMRLYIHTVFLGVHATHVDLRDDSCSHVRMQPSVRLTPEDEAAVEAALAILSKTTSFSFRVESTVDKAGAVTAPNRSMRELGDPLTAPLNMVGWSADVIIKRELYDSTVEQYHNEGGQYEADSQPRRYSIEMLKLWLQFTMTLVHEFGHVCQWACRDSAYEELFMGDAEVCEGGYDLEQWMFGGISCTSWPVPERFFLHDWPDPEVVAKYLHNGANISMAQEPEEMKRPNTVQCWQVPDAWVVALFQQSSWKWDQNVDARPPKMLGLQALAITCHCRRLHGEDLEGVRSTHDFDRDAKDRGVLLLDKVPEVHRKRLVGKTDGLTDDEGLARHRLVSVPQNFERYADGTLIRRDMIEKLEQLAWN